MTARQSETDALFEGEHLRPILTDAEKAIINDDLHRRAAPKTAAAVRRMANPPTDSQGRPIPPPPRWWSNGRSAADKPRQRDNAR